MPEPPSPHGRLGPAFDGVLGAAQANAGWAFKAIYEAFAPGIAAYARSQGAFDPDGLTNEVLFAAFRALHRFRGDETRFRSWLFTITHNRVIDDRRKRAREVPRSSRTPEEDVLLGGDVEEEALARLGDAGVRALLDRLTADQRNVLLLRVVADLSIAQVAQIVGKPPGAVKALQRRGLAAVQRQFEHEGVSL